MATTRDTIEMLDSRWSGAGFHADVLWSWNTTNGVFSYFLERNPDTNKFQLTIERCDAGRAKVLGPFASHQTATAHVLKHLTETQH